MALCTENSLTTRFRIPQEQRVIIGESLQISREPMIICLPVQDRLALANIG
jgi:hypothetical protein